MILSKKITFERFNELKEKSSFIQELDSFIEKNPKSKIKKDELENFSFYFVLEYFNGFDSINYEKIFPQKSFFIDYQALQDEHNNIMNKISKRILNHLRLRIQMHRVQRGDAGVGRGSRQLHQPRVPIRPDLHGADPHPPQRVQP